MSETPSIAGQEVGEHLVRTGAELLMDSAANAGIDTCFANPGTTEMPLVAALDSRPGVRAVLGLFEGVCTGAADGYGRITGRPAMTLLHLGPGFANGIANLHNARRARTPVLNVIGDHASWHVKYDAPLTSDIHSLANPVSGWVRTSACAADLAADTGAAVAASIGPPGQVASLVVPADFQQEAVTVPPVARTLPHSAGTTVTGDRVDAVARRFRAAGSRAVLLLGGNCLTAAGQHAAGRIAQATGATLYSETFPSVAERGGGLPDIDRLPYFPEVAIGALEDADVVVLAGAEEPVAYFGYDGIPSLLAPAGSIELLSAPQDDGPTALAAVADALGAPDRVRGPVRDSKQGVPSGALDGRVVGRVVADLLPEGSIVSVEGATCGYPFFTASATAPRHTVLTNTGGAIGQGLPCALGAALAAPERPVIALQSDGSAQYTVQALWTMAREATNVVVLIAANRSYNVLRKELTRHGSEDFGPQARALTSLSNPDIDWVALARGYGVGACRATTGTELATGLRSALAEQGPQLIEMVL